MSESENDLLHWNHVIAQGYNFGNKSVRGQTILE